MELKSFYENTFLRNEINGIKFICLTEESLSPLKIENELHRVKILEHVDELRKCALEYVYSLIYPIDFFEWNSIQLAAWFFGKLKYARYALIILQQKLDGKLLFG